LSTVVLKGISKSYGRSSVLSGLDFEVPEGSVVAVLGKSGSGKTTLLRLVAGFERPSEGTVEIDGETVDSAEHFIPPERRRVGYVAQEGNLFPHLTVEKNVAFGLSRPERASGRVQELLRLVGLSGFAKRYPHELSGGQQQRVALARALAPRPKVLLLDEPFSSLDAGLRASLRSEVMALLRDQGATTLFVTHDQEEALSVADMVGVLEAGRIRQFAPPEELYARPVDPAIAEFVGDANILPGQVANGWARTPLGRLPATTRDGTLATFQGAASVLVRPEQISLHPLRARAAAAEEAVGSVVHTEFYGHDCLVVVDLVQAANGSAQPVATDETAHARLRVRCPGRPPVQVGEAVALAVNGQLVTWPAS
jgi:iron(III) transport system ATP-binding protein